MLKFKMTGRPPKQLKLRNMSLSEGMAQGMKNTLRRLADGADWNKKDGPECRFCMSNSIPGQPIPPVEQRRLSRVEMAFGVGSPPDSPDKKTPRKVNGIWQGWKGLVEVQWILATGPDSPAYGVVTVEHDSHRAAEVGADVWIEEFMRDILSRSKWKIASCEVIASDKGTE